MDSTLDAQSTAALKTVVLADIADSTAIVEELGDRRTADFFQAHDRMLSNLLLTNQGRLIDRSDGAFALFDRPIQALSFALHYQRQLAELGTSFAVTLRARIGIHVGDVVVWESSAEAIALGSKPLNVEGLAKPVASRLMQLAMPGQILMSGMAQALCQRAQSELGELADRIDWRVHGRYRFRGVEAAMLVHEAGERGVAPMFAPGSGHKSWRSLPFWRRPPIIALEVMLAATLAIAGFGGWFHSEPVLAFADRDWVVVADLQNLSGDATFSTVVPTALKISLAQSQYINIVPDRQTHRALRHMQRGPEDPLDRSTSAEIAVREGARAVILPTLASIGGRYRLSLELIQPDSGVTVYTQSADVVNPDDVVSALDGLVKGIRESLGEDHDAVSKRSLPLHQVTTANLDALRAYSMAQYYDNRGEPKLMMAMFARAVELDPAFSMAYLRMATRHYANGSSSEALRYFDLANAHRQRLTEREALLLDAARFLVDQPDRAYRGFKVLGDIYPDEFTAHYSAAWVALYHLSRPDWAKQSIQPALSVKNSYLYGAHYLLGTIEMALGDQQAAQSAFLKSDALGVSGYLGDYAQMYAVERDYVAAQAVLDRQTSQSVNTDGIEYFVEQVLFPLDQGDRGQALEQARALLVAMTGGEAADRISAEGILLSLRSYDADADDEFAEDLRAFVADLAAAITTANPLDRRHQHFALAAAAWMAYKTGDVSLGDTALKVLDANPQSLVYSPNAQMLSVARSEQAIQRDDLQRAEQALGDFVSAPQASVFLMAQLARVQLRRGNMSGAMNTLQWLNEHRGRAYAEPSSNFIWSAVNLMEQNLAAPTLMQLLRLNSESSLKNQLSAEFEQAWPNLEDRRWARQYAKSLVAL